MAPRTDRPAPTSKGRTNRGDRLRRLRSFCLAVRTGSMTRAAENGASSQPAVSQHVSRLEEEFGVTLFERRGPRIILTRVGECLYRLALPLVESVDRMPDTFAELHRGVVSGDLEIAAGMSSATLVLPRFLRRLQDEHPGVRVNLRVGDGAQRLEWLRSHQVDIVYCAMEFPSPDLEFHPALFSHMVLITPEEHPLAGREVVEIGEAMAYPAVVHSPARDSRQVGELLLRRHGTTANVAVQVDGWTVIKAYVEAGAGISVVPDVCLSKQDRVWRVPFTKYFPSRRYGMLMRRGGCLPLAAASLLRLIVSSVPGES